MVALLLILRDCGVAAKNTLFKHCLRSDRPQLSSACTKNQLSNVPSEIFNLKRNRPRNLHEQICNFREQVVRAGCKLLRANCQSKYQHCGRSLQSCAEKNIRFDCNCWRYLALIRKVESTLQHSCKGCVRHTTANKDESCSNVTIASVSCPRASHFD